MLDVVSSDESLASAQLTATRQQASTTGTFAIETPEGVLCAGFVTFKRALYDASPGQIRWGTTL
jgi:hypothetical protein